MSNFEKADYGYVDLAAIQDDLSEVAARESEDIMIDGFPVHADYSYSIFSRGFVANVTLSLDDCLRLETIPLPPNACAVDRINLTLDGKVVLSTYAMGSIDYLHREINQKKAALDRARLAQKLQDQVADMAQAALQMRENGLPVMQLEALIDHARTSVLGMSYYWAKRAYDTALSSVRAVEREIDRIKDGGSQLLVEELIAGRVDHPHVYKNAEIINQINVFAIRSGGQFGVAFDEAQLYDFYVERVGEVTSTQELARRDLLIPVGDYVIDDPDDELGLAPQYVQIETRKGLSSFYVTYDYRDVDGKKVAVGMISVPYATYERNAAEYGRSSRFPSLPHNIQLWVQVTLDSKAIAGGWDDLELRKRVKKHVDGIKRGRKVSHADQNQHAHTPPPPWLTTRVRRR